MSFTGKHVPAVFILVTALLLLFAQPLLAEEVPQREGDVRSMMASLSDEQVRSLLLEELQKDLEAQADSTAGADGPGAVFNDMLTGLENISASNDGNARKLLSKLPELLPDLYKVFVQLCPFGTPKGALENLAKVIFFLLLGLTVEAAIRKTVLIRLVRREPVEVPDDTSRQLEKLTTSLLIELPALLGVFFFFIAAYFSYSFFIWAESPALRLFFLAALICISIIRLILISSRIIFSPGSLPLRILPIECHIARLLHGMIVSTATYAILALMFIVITRKLGAQPETVALLQLILASALLLVTALLTLIFKGKVRNQILSSAEENNESPSWGRKQLAAIWHIPTLLYLFCIWLLLFSSLMQPGQHARGAFLLSFFILPIWIIADITLQWIIRYSMDVLRIHSEEYEETGEITEEEQELRNRGKKTYLRTKSLARFALIVGMVIWVASLWNIRIPIISRLSSAMFDTLLILTLAMLFWKFISDWIERKINESIPEEEEGKEEDDEWGSAATRGRSYTLLPMLRKFIATVLMTMVTLTILSSLGVDIGPLLAGAGVVGLAVGFGAQKLVADMFSGFFYLLDDAFRVGEYIEAGGIMGTVENISLRNVMLRHHRGMLQIVPHSELGSITNYMRGGIVVKFNLDFPYDANIDQIRKVIKKVGIAMLEDEEFGDDFIKPVKSQGVREITNSVMTIRVKFTAKPGAHFVIRREAYRRITEALRAKGIEYAHKKVIVDLPPIPAGTPEATREQIAKAAGAAAKQIQEEEQQKLNQQESSKDQSPFD